MTERANGYKHGVIRQRERASDAKTEPEECPDYWRVYSLRVPDIGRLPVSYPEVPITGRVMRSSRLRGELRITVTPGWHSGTSRDRALRRPVITYQSRKLLAPKYADDGDKI